ncbi:gamma-glutamyltransferase [Marinobacter nanhaiticus D15-8W]|uniref:Glutathione hydrolase proenzyme n=1 Tax=Marinobacter nanhaiticus D15-8W TaxID=626887 RepID=N6VRN5_9GAMM|nr:gamma-glutamyltransferase [Marinobacter nanhaiticus]ENO12850.1 gamma-glutamyltransferase [Marinobacter nanhaiticus D15-8W]BES70200.1 gamma-glutamyltransferase [Marinobacter nanhaiticus D15-8W]
MLPQPADFQEASQWFRRIAGDFRVTAVGCVLLFFLAVTCVVALSGKAMAATDAPGNAEIAREMMVVSGNPLASEVGLAVLRRGGNAVDAAVAVQMMMSFVAGPSTGIGGGGFMVYRNGSTGEIDVYDGREMAPSGMSPYQLMAFRGVPGLEGAMPLWFAVISGHGIGVPGTVAMLHLAHQDHGTLPWKDLLQPAIDAAQDGVPIPERLSEQVDFDPSLALFHALDHAFVEPASAGDHPRLQNPELARTLERVADEGLEAFYQGEIPRDFVRTARDDTILGSPISIEDFAHYRAIKREPICGNYREWTVCGPPPPDGGGLGVLQILGILEHYDMSAMAPKSVEAIHLFSEASRLALADVHYYVGDPDFVDIPLASLLDKDYLAQRADLIEPQNALADVKPGMPPTAAINDVAGPLEYKEEHGTSHFSIVDADGGVVSMTNSNAAPFGSRVMTHGFVINSQLTDFDFVPYENGKLKANAPEPHKRPRSSMSPIIVLDPEGQVRLVMGSRGGGRIIDYVAKVVVGVLDWDLSVQDAIELPNIVNQGEILEIEEGTVPEAIIDRLEAMGHDVDVDGLMSGLHGIERHADGWRGGTDPRVDGAIAGQ